MNTVKTNKTAIQQEMIAKIRVEIDAKFPEKYKSEWNAVEEDVKEYICVQVLLFDHVTVDSMVELIVAEFEAAQNN